MLSDALGLGLTLALTLGETLDDGETLALSLGETLGDTRFSFYRAGG